MLDMSVLARYKYNKYKTDKEFKKDDKILVLLTKNNLKNKNIVSL
jgi:hypothetical protein